MGSLAIPLTLLALAAVLMIVVIFIQVAAIKDHEELRQLFAIQRTRMDEATELWRKETGQYYTLPDLGELLQWLMERNGGTK